MFHGQLLTQSGVNVPVRLGQGLCAGSFNDPDSGNSDRLCLQEVPRAFDQEQTFVRLCSHVDHVFHEPAEVGTAGGHQSVRRRRRPQCRGVPLELNGEAGATLNFFASTLGAFTHDIYDKAVGFAATAHKTL